MFVRYMPMVATLVALLSPPLFAQFSPNSSENAVVTIHDASASGMTITVKGLRPVTAGNSVAAGTTLHHNAGLYLHARDTNSLPELRFTVGIPFDATNPTIEIVKAEQRQVSMTLASVDALEGLPDVDVWKGAEMRGIRTIVVAYRPFRYSGGTLKYDSDAELRVSWDLPAGSSFPSARDFKEIPGIEKGLQRMILNYDQAKEWRRSAVRIDEKIETALASSAASGWGMGEPSLVLSVPETGVYRLTGAEFADATQAGSPAIADLRMHNQKVPVPFFVIDGGATGVFDADDVIEFRGDRNPGEVGMYWNEITDTNAYVLTWSGGPGNPPVPAVTSRPTFASISETYDSTLHFEEERFWFGGISRFDGDEKTLFISDRVQQERFYWRVATRTKDDPLEFNCSPHYENGGKITMSVRVAGGIYKPMEGGGIQSIKQRLLVFVNGFQMADTITIADTNDVLASLTFPSYYIVNGTNRVWFELLPIDNDGIGMTISGDIRVDYLELKGKWKAFHPGDVSMLPTSSGSNVGMRVVGMASPPERAITADASVSTDSLQQGHLYRLTSRNTATVRIASGFFWTVGEEEFRSPENFNMGITLVEVEPTPEGGREVRSAHFQMNLPDDNAVNANFAAATTFLREVRSGNIVLAGLAYGTNKHDKPEEFIRELEALGSKVVRNEDFFAAGWAFAARKGDASTATETFGSAAGNDVGVTLNAFIPDSEGSVWRAVVPASNASRQDLVAGRVQRPALRYHASDELLASDNQADLIIIAHPKFRAEAERLAQHRSDHNGYSFKVVDIYRIYDEFNNGQKHPIAIRRFLQYADTNWADPMPGFVLLFGDASWDGAQRMSQSIMVDYIPSWGVPSTDYIYSVAFGDTTLFPRQLLGRIPVTSEEDARAVVDKIVEYDSQPPARWNKKFVFATGGNSVAERDQLRDFTHTFLASEITSEPFFGEATVISRSGKTNAELQFPSTVDGQKVRDTINKGALWLDFFGHGATTTLDLNYGLPEDFDNESLYFILATWSCQTGLFSDPTAALRNERFVTIPKKGTVASFGGTSFSYTNTDNSNRQRLYWAISDPAEGDPDRNLGFIILMAKYRMFEDIGFGEFDNNEVRYRNHVLTYNLLGDPSMDIAVRRTPELALTEQSTTLTTDRNSPPDLGDTVVIVRTALWNYGERLRGQLYDSGVVVTATLVNEKGTELTRSATVRRLDRYQTLEFRLPLTLEPGEYIVRLEADPEELAMESYREDNLLTLTFLLRGAQPLSLEPLPYAVLPGYDDITIRLLNPQSGPGAEFTLDTVPTFDSPGRITSAATGNVTETELTTLWNLSIPSGLRSARTFWWKAISTSADPGTAERFPLVESFSVKSEGRDEVVALQGVDQMALTRLVDLVNGPNGIGPGTQVVPIRITAIGQSFKDTTGSERLVPPGGRFLSILIGGEERRVDPREGLNVLAFNPNDATPVIDTAFALYDINVKPGLQEFERLIDEAVQAGQKVVVATSGSSFLLDQRYENGLNRLIEKLRLLGSSVDTTLGIEDTYVLLGGKGLSPDQVKEEWINVLPLRRAGGVPPWIGTLEDTIIAFPKAGTWGSPVFGPAVAWRRAEFDLDPASNQPLNVSVVGVRRDGVRDTIVRTTVSPANPTADLSGIDLLKYPRLEIAARFVNDTAQRLRSVSVDFDPSPELAFVPSTLRMSPDSVLQGDPATVEATIVNLTSWREATNIFTSLVSMGEAVGAVADSSTIASIPALDSVRVTFTIDTDRIRTDRPFMLFVNPADIPSEPYIHNNRLAPPLLRVTGDRIPPGYAIYADDHRLMNGDYVAPSPVLEVRFYDNSQLDLDPGSTVTLVLDNEWIDTAKGTFEALAKGDLRAFFRYVPPVPLAEGPHDLLVFATDASGNGDTSEIITFYVEKNLNIRQAVNWPNPFERETTFTFVLTGEMHPESGEIDIFTAAGRKIKSIPLGPDDLNVGFNTVEWDGLDEDRDRLANGVYFYRLKIRAGDSTSEVVEKIVVLR